MKVLVMGMSTTANFYGTPTVVSYLSSFNLLRTGGEHMLGVDGNEPTLTCIIQVLVLN